MQPFACSLGLQGLETPSVGAFATVSEDFHKSYPQNFESEKLAVVATDGFPQRK
jgi:hypothetical protein